MSRRVDAAMERLPDLLQSGLSHAEIAAEIGVSKKTVTRKVRQLGLRRTPEAELAARKRLAERKAKTFHTRKFEPSFAEANEPRKPNKRMPEDEYWTADAAYGSTALLTGILKLQAKEAATCL